MAALIQNCSCSLSSWHVVFYVVLSLNVVDLHRE